MMRDEISSNAPEHAALPAGGPTTEQFTSPAFLRAREQVLAANAEWERFAAAHGRWLVGKNKKRKPRPDAPAQVHDEFKAYVQARDAASAAYNSALSAPPISTAAETPVHEAACIDASLVHAGLDAADLSTVTNDWADLIADPGPGERVRMADRVGPEQLSAEQAQARVESWRQHAIRQGETHGAENWGRTVLSLYDKTGKWAEPWALAGYNVVTFDIQTGQDVNDFSVEWFTENYDLTDVFLILVAQPCTDFASSGSRHFLTKDFNGQTECSVNLTKQSIRTIEYFRPMLWSLENPNGRIRNLTGLPQSRLEFDPSHFGDPYTKETHIYGRFNANLPFANVAATEGSKMWKRYGGSSLETKNARSETAEGFSYAYFMANNYVDMPAKMRLPMEYPLASGAVRAALRAGVSEAEIHEMMEYTYGNYEDVEARNVLIAEIAKRVPDVAAPRGIPVHAEQMGFSW